MRYLFILFLLAACAPGDRLIHKNPNPGSSSAIKVTDGGGAEQTSMTADATGVQVPGTVTAGVAAPEKIIYSWGSTTFGTGGGPVALDGSKGTWLVDTQGNVTFTITIAQGQQVTVAVKNSRGTGDITTTWSHSPNSPFWKDASPKAVVAPGTLNVYTMINIGGEIFMTAVDNMAEYP